MMISYRIRRVIYSFAFVILVFGNSLAFASSGVALSEEARLNQARNSIINNGFENVRLMRLGNSLHVEYENRIFRNELVAAGVIAHILSQNMADSSQLVLIPLNRGIPMCAIHINSADYRNFISGKISNREFANTLKIDEYSQISSQAGGASRDSRVSSSFRKLDFTVSPGHTIQLGNYEDSFKFYGYFVPDISTHLWPGAALRMQLIIPVYDEIGMYTKEVRLSRLALNQTLRLPAGGLVSVSVGAFEPTRYGISSEAGYFLLNRRFWVGAGLDYTGFLLYQKKEWTYSKETVRTDRAFIYYFLPWLDFSVGVQYADYLMGDHGWLMDVSRTLGDFKIGFYVARTNLDKFGGFRLSVPLSPMRQPAARRVRLNWPSSYNWNYRMTSETITYDVPLATGQTISTGFELIDFQKKLVTSYIRNNVGWWKKVDTYVK
jgi:hypothetical protein